jgi:hypothetical protein
VEDEEEEVAEEVVVEEDINIYLFNFKKLLSRRLLFLFFSNNINGLFQVSS